ncbi:MAG: long-chain fatty acid--CoA ligase, partial [Thermoplasmata archaeon]|nr:long-chain fatty acid--CoA ligase [Thermoplasmata archaeon]
MQGEVPADRPWFSHWPDGVPHSLGYPDIPVHELLRRTAKQHGERPALTFYGKTMTYRELDAAVDRFAAGL